MLCGCHEGVIERLFQVVNQRNDVTFVDSEDKEGTLFVSCLDHSADGGVDREETYLYAELVIRNMSSLI